MLGTIIGDIAGSTREFNNVKTDKFKLIPKGSSYTDDTICTCAIALSALEGIPYDSSLQYLCHRHPRPMGGYGTSFYAWLRSSYPAPYYSFGNGSAMRVSPIGWIFDNPTSTINEARSSASVTHDHPEGLKGAETIALCIYKLRNGGSKVDVLDYVESGYGEIPDYEPFSNPFLETCMNAVPVSVSCFLASTSFEDAIHKAIAVGGDSDTIGAITGSLAEAYYGVPKDLAAQAYSMLSQDLQHIVRKFYQRIGKEDLLP